LDPFEVGAGAAHPLDLAQAEEPVAVDLFDTVWETFDRLYPYFDHKGIDWDDFRVRHRPRFERIEGDAETFAPALAAALAELRDLHVNVRLPDGRYLEVYNPPWERNFTSIPRFRYAVAGYEVVGSGALWHGWLHGGIAYLRVDTLLTEAFAEVEEADLDAIFDRYRDASGMIVDIRPNAGGNEEIAMAIAGRFIETPLLYGYFQMRSGPGRTDFGPRQEKVLQPSSGHHFDGPVVCLVGPRNMSSAEWFALMIAANPDVVLIGAQTRGSSGNPLWVELPNGVSFSVSRWIPFRADGEILEGRGVTPNVVIPAAASFDQLHDYVVEAALERLGALDEP
jgi:hypothetical protein